MADRRREIAEQVGHVIETASLTIAEKKVLREAASLLGSTCATCKHHHVGHYEHGPAMTEGQCRHPSEAHPLHWQTTRDTFGCNLHDPAPPVAAPSEPTA